MAEEQVPQWLRNAGGWSWRLIVILAAVALGVAALLALRSIVLPLFFAVLLSTYLVPLVLRLRNRGLHRSLAAMVGMLLLAALLAGLAALTVYAIVDQADEIRAQVEEGIDELEREAGDQFGQDTVDDARQNIEDGLANLQEVGVRGAVRVASVALEVVAGTILTAFALFYILRDGDRMWGQAVRFFGGSTESFLLRAGANAWKQITGYMLGTAAIAAVDAILIGGGAALLSVPSALAVTVLTFFASFVPYVGAVVAGAFAVVLALADGGVGTAIVMLLIVLAVQQIEGNILQPVIQSRFVTLHPLVIILAVTAGGALGGIVGMVLAVPVTAVVSSVVSDLKAIGYFEEGELR